MDRSNHAKKRRLRGIAQPVPFKGMSIVMQESEIERTRIEECRLMAILE